MTGFRPMAHIFKLAGVLALVGAAHAQDAPPADPQPADAQPASDRAAAALDAEAAAPEIHGVLVDSQRVLDRLKLMLDLTTAQEKKQYKTLKDYIEVFLPGVDKKKPIRMDVLTGQADTTYRLYVPVDDFRDFWKENLDPLGIPVRKFKNTQGEYRLGGGRDDAFDGYMLHDPKQREGYAIIIEKPPGQKDPKWPGPELQQPLPAVQDLIAAGYDAALRLRNRPDGVDVRHRHYAQNKDEVLGKLKRDTDESVSDFNLRKFFAGIQFDESERLYAEAKEFVAGLTVTPKPEQAAMKLRIDPLPETSLAASVALIGQQPSRFAGIPAGENAASTGRINFPLDEFRKKNALDLTQKVLENKLEEIEADKTATAEQRESRKEFANLLSELMKAGIGAGVADGFVEVTKEGETYTTVGGMKAPDGKAWVPLVELLSKTDRVSEVKMNTGEHAGVSLHELTFEKEKHADFYELFGGGRLIAGTGPDAVWYAAGPKAEEALKQAIDQAAQPGEPSPTFLSFRGELLPIVQVLNYRLGKTGREKYRDMAVQAFQNGEGRLTMNLTRNGDAIDGETTLDRGVLRLLGKGLADFSKENLE